MLHVLLVLAGVGQLVLIVASLAIPRVLGWRDELAKVKPLTRQVFWTYSAYIWSTNLAFGLLSTFAPELLLDRSRLAGWVASFIALYWGGRVGIQFFYYDRSARPPGPIFVLAEVALVGLFVALTAIYAAIAWTTFHGGGA